MAKEIEVDDEILDEAEKVPPPPPAPVVRAGVPLGAAPRAHGWWGGCVQGGASRAPQDLMALYERDEASKLLRETMKRVIKGLQQLTRVSVSSSSSKVAATHIKLTTEAERVIDLADEANVPAVYVAQAKADLMDVQVPCGTTSSGWCTRRSRTSWPSCTSTRSCSSGWRARWAAPTRCSTRSRSASTRSSGATRRRRGWRR